jgi:putative LysE/RhtB family amino acid efflux pump
VTATALNPLTIALWTVSFPAAAPGAARGSIAHTAELLLGVAVGTLTWYSGFSTAVALARKRAGDALVRTVDVASGLGLVAFGGVLAYRTVTE